MKELAKDQHQPAGQDDEATVIELKPAAYGVAAWPEVWRYVAAGQPVDLDPDDPQLIGMKEAAGHFPALPGKGGRRKPNPEKAARYCRKGVAVGRDLDGRPVYLKLEAVKIGRDLMTSREAIGRFQRRQGQGSGRAPFRLNVGELDGHQQPTHAVAATSLTTSTRTPAGTSRRSPRRHGPGNEAAKARLDAAGICRR